MKLNLLALTSLLALAAAQDASTTSTGKASATTSLSPEASCAQNTCSDSDRCCIAACYHVPCPSDQQANDTNSCVAACPQGTGSPSDTQKYADCQSRCFSSHFFPASATNGGGSHSTGSSNSKTTGASDSDSTATGSSGSGAKETGSGTATASGANASTTSSENAAAIAKVGMSAISVAGVALGIWAL